MSRLCRLKSYKSIGEDGVWAYNEIISLRTTITEQAKRIQQLEDALRDARDALDYGDSDKRIDAVTAIDELIGE